MFIVIVNYESSANVNMGGWGGRHFGWSMQWIYEKQVNLANLRLRIVLFIISWRTFLNLILLIYCIDV